MDFTGFGWFKNAEYVNPIDKLGRPKENHMQLSV